MSVSVLLAGVVTPELAKGPVGLEIVKFFKPDARNPMDIPEFPSELRADRVEHAATHEVVVMDAEAAREIGSRVATMKDRWQYNIRGRGLPHFSLGYKYGEGWANGTYHTYRSWRFPDPLWDEFSGMYESIREAISKNAGRPARLHTGIMAPAFQVHLPNLVFGMPNEVHRDPWIGPQHWTWKPFLKDDLLRTVGKDLECNVTEQKTFLLSLLAPRGSGVRVWRYSGNRTRCPDGVVARLECIEEAYHEYREGRMIMFESAAAHSAVMPLSLKSTASDIRMLVVGFVVPCRVNGQIEEQVIGSFAR